MYYLLYQWYSKQCLLVDIFDTEILPIPRKKEGGSAKPLFIAAIKSEIHTFTLIFKSGFSVSIFKFHFVFLNVYLRSYLNLILEHFYIYFIFWMFLWFLFISFAYTFFLIISIFMLVPFFHDCFPFLNFFNSYILVDIKGNIYFSNF